MTITPDRTPPEWATTITPWGIMTVNRYDLWVGSSLLAYGEFSPGEWRFLRDLLRPGDVVLDIGANVGALTLPLAESVGHTGHVIAIEPQEAMAELLRLNVLNRTSKAPVTVLQKAVGAAPGTLHIPPQAYDRPGNFGGVELGGERGDEVEVITVDSLNLERLALLKADVEGMELDVIEGARDTITRCRPILYIESDRMEKRQALLQAVESLGYRIQYHAPPLFSPENARGLRVPLLQYFRFQDIPAETVGIVQNILDGDVPNKATHLIDVIAELARRTHGIVSINVVCTPQEANLQPWELPG